MPGIRAGVLAMSKPPTALEVRWPPFHLPVVWGCVWAILTLVLKALGLFHDNGTIGVWGMSAAWFVGECWRSGDRLIARPSGGERRGSSPIIIALAWTCLLATMFRVIVEVQPDAVTAAWCVWPAVFILAMGLFWVESRIVMQRQRQRSESADIQEHEQQRR